MLEEIKTNRPDLLTRRFNVGAPIDKKDNGLRVPRRVL